MTSPVNTIVEIGKHNGHTVATRGWVYNLRESSTMIFPQFVDGLGCSHRVVPKNSVTPGRSYATMIPCSRLATLGRAAQIAGTAAGHRARRAREGGGGRATTPAAPSQLDEQVASGVALRAGSSEGA